MTREKAIEALGNGAWWDMVNIFLPCDSTASTVLHDAVDMAIATLNAQKEPNTPLTLEELREMDGEPVWVKWDATQGFYALICGVKDGGLYYVTPIGHTEYAPFPLFGDSWTAYRRKPEEGTS